MMNIPPKPKKCSKCGHELKPELVGTSIDSNFNTVPHYMYGHTCPAQLKAYDHRMEDIANSQSMTPEQKANARSLAGYMNTWAN